MIRQRWAARPGQGGVLNRETTERAMVDVFREMLAGPDLRGAACAETDPEIFYPEKGDSASAHAARTLCRGGELNGKRIPPCPVRAACLARALDMEDQFTHWGTWGGYTARRIRRMRRFRDALRSHVCPPTDQAA